MDGGEVVLGQRQESSQCWLCTRPRICLPTSKSSLEMERIMRILNIISSNEALGWISLVEAG